MGGLNSKYTDFFKTIRIEVMILFLIMLGYECLLFSMFFNNA